MVLTKRIIPCIDVDIDEDGNAAGADEFVFLDITASAEGRETMLDTVKSVADEVFIPLTVGGGIRTREDIKETLRAGADKVSINTGARAPGTHHGRGALLWQSVHRHQRRRPA